MELGMILIIAYWAIFTVRVGFRGKHMRKSKEALYEMKFAAKGEDEARKKKATLNYCLLKICGKILKVVGWIETIILLLIIAWILFLIGAVITGSFVILGYPV